MSRRKEKNYNKTRESQEAARAMWEEGLESLRDIQEAETSRRLEEESDSAVSDSLLRGILSEIRGSWRKVVSFLRSAVTGIWTFLKAIWRKKDVIGDVIKNKHRFVVMDSQTYKEKLSFQLTGINLFVVLGVSMIVLVVLTTLIIAFTPLREFIPGYANTKMTEQTFQNAVVIDSLETQLRSQEQMLADIKAIMMGQDPSKLRDSKEQATPTDTAPPSPYSHSREDSLLRVEVESADKYSVRTSPKRGEAKEGDKQGLATTPVSMQLFFTPMKGKVIASYDPKIKHYGVDIAGATNEVVKSVMSGTVLLSEFTVETGYVLIIQHAGNYISVYKHNSSLLKREGDVVRAGEPIAYLGNSGELTSGPHLHFELWLAGKPVNPLQYISF